MRIQYASDLHLELWQKTTFDETLQVVAPYLVLCGDVAPLNCVNLRAFLEYCSERWKLIFWIPGNSEIWKTSKSENEKYFDFLKMDKKKCPKSECQNKSFGF